MTAVVPLLIKCNVIRVNLPMKTLEALYSMYGCAIPPKLAEWDDAVSDWCDEYQSVVSDAMILEFNLELGAYLFDQSLERVVLAYAISQPALHVRNKGRIRGFPDVNKSVRAVLHDKAFPADRGHFLGHASGGQLDVNLFPQSRALNRGWSEEGKQFRRMESFVASNNGTFFYHRPIYIDETWVPSTLEFGVLVENRDWWSAKFDNRK